MKNNIDCPENGAALVLKSGETLTIKPCGRKADKYPMNPELDERYQLYEIKVNGTKAGMVAAKSLAEAIFSIFKNGPENGEDVIVKE